jgi:ABC-type multidrug transport system fused ATPase/permease subunit
MDKGKVVEFDTPLNLIQQEGSAFRGMCMKTGNLAELEALAKP